MAILIKPLHGCIQWLWAAQYIFILLLKKQQSPRVSRSLRTLAYELAVQQGADRLHSISCFWLPVNA